MSVPPYGARNSSGWARSKMILSDRSIREKIEDGVIVVDPEPTEEQYQPASLDVRLDSDVVMEPGDSPQPYTMEHIALPNTIGAFVTGRSSIARQKIIVHKTAGWIDPGFHGQIKFEMLNHSDEKKTLLRGQRVAQLIFYPLDKPAAEPYDGQYQGQTAPPDYVAD